ncbi:hypothetical protein WJ97_14505 [Burkholderia ubonensis]|uniref:hypothetical protein n=1 Tax=Burkholderia ubonensis TaxID=101571 RepID=UPI0007576EAA|nr:hypothetical protein [Burkholderia ubonensis]KVP97027.1 hypothetical protein WJ97_14505 [Burkholderia ubonensis]
MKNSIKRGALNVTVAVIVALAFTLLFGPTNNTVAGLVFVVLTTVIGSVALQVASNRYDARLTQRMEAKDSPTWDVQLNGVKVGRITDAEYAGMQQRAFRDGRNALAQLLNLGRMALVAVDKLVVAVPVVFFWGAVALVLFAPESYTEVIREFQKADAAATAKAIAAFVQVGITVAVMAVGLMAAMGYRFGFRDYYGEAVNRMLRQHFNTPAEGDVHLFRVAADSDVEFGRVSTN